MGRPNAERLKPLLTLAEWIEELKKLPQDMLVGELRVPPGGHASVNGERVFFTGDGARLYFFSKGPVTLS